jgi:hypothetical protein
MGIKGTGAVCGSVLGSQRSARSGAYRPDIVEGRLPGVSSLRVVVMVI